MAVGKEKKAEEILKTAAATATAAAPYLALADFYFTRKRWSDAAAQYGKALERERSNSLTLHLRGAALSKAGQVAEGQTLKERAHLLPLADEEARYNLAQGLAQHGLKDDADAEWLVLVRTAPFRSIYATNAASSLASKAAREKRPLEAARYYRFVYLNLARARCVSG